VTIKSPISRLKRVRLSVVHCSLFIFLLAFLPRAIYPVSRPLQWYFRSARFFRAVLEGDWASTLFSEHPGVTVMWLSGAAQWGWYGLRSLLGLDPPAPLQTEGYAFADRVAVGVLPLALIVALGIVWGWHLLRRLFGQRAAWTAAILWALDPFYLANSKMLHLDALLSMLMLLSALWMLVYLRERRLRPLVISAILGGLAVLTKVTAIFLIPFLGLVLLVDIICNKRRAMRNTPYAVRDLLLWLLVAAVTCFALWPSLWVQPGESLGLIYQKGYRLHADQPRENPMLYRGVLAIHDPGPRFYADVLLFRTTFLTLPLAFMWPLLLARRQREEKLSIGLLVALAFFYFIQMSLGNWKSGRYILPILLVLDVLAALALQWWAERLLGNRQHQSLVIGGLLAAQALIVLPHHPYYGTHYNLLMGGPRAALRVFPPADFGEGVDLAGQYVDQLPGAEDFVVGTQFLANEMLAQYVRASVWDVRQIGDDADYLVFGVQYTMRGTDIAYWGDVWNQTYRFREPEFVAAFDGIPYAWVHRPEADPVIPREVGVRLGQSIRLVGYRLVQDRVVPGDTLLLTLYWRAEAPVEGNYTVFTHLQGPGGQLVAQQDNPPGRGTRPTSGWEIGVLIEDPYEIPVPPDASFEDYTLSVGMYDPATVERLATFGADGGRLPEDRVVLATVEVRPAVPGWRWALSGAWLAIIAAGIAWPWLRRRK
jgi:hypothetical protein